MTPGQSQPRGPYVVRVLSGQQAGAHEPLSRGDRLIVGGDLSDDLVLAGVKNARLLMRVDDEGRCLLTALRPGVTCQGQTFVEGHHLEPPLPALLDLDGITIGVGLEQTDWQNLRATYQQESAGTAPVVPAPQPKHLGISATTIAQVMVTGLLAAALSVGLYYTYQKDEFSKTEQVSPPSASSIPAMTPEQAKMLMEKVQQGHKLKEEQKKALEELDSEE